jgi:hypothetical protein
MRLHDAMRNYHYALKAQGQLYLHFEGKEIQFSSTYNFIIATKLTSYNKPFL